MIEEREHVVQEIVEAAGGRLVSRIRLQKIAYLVEQLGANAGIDFSYHHYGPYSRELDAAVFDADALDLVKETSEFRKSDGARYSVFVNQKHVDHWQILTDEALRNLVSDFAKETITTLELAATAHWLVTYEKVKDWEVEIKRRKGSKTADGRLDQARLLLARIGLPPESERQAQGA